MIIENFPTPLLIFSGSKERLKTKVREVKSKGGRNS